MFFEFNQKISKDDGPFLLKLFLPNYHKKNLKCLKLINS